MAPFSTTPPSSSSSSNNNGEATVYRRKMNSSLSSSSCNNWRSDTADLPMYYNNNNHNNLGSSKHDKNGRSSSSSKTGFNNKTRSIVGVMTFTFCIAIIVVLGINKEIDIKIAAIMDPPPPRLQLYEQQNNRPKRRVVDQQQQLQQQKKEDVKEEQQQKQQHQKHRQRRDEQQQQKKNEDVEKEQQQKQHVIEADEEDENENNVPSTTIRQDLQPIMVDHTTVKKMENEEDKSVITAKQQLSSSSSDITTDTTTDNIITYDIVIAGAGPSGLTAALFASRAGLNVYVLGSHTTGLLSQTKHLDNFPSFTGTGTGSSGTTGKTGVVGNGGGIISDTSSSAGSGTGPGWLEATYTQAQFWGTKFGPSGLLISSIERRRRSKQDEEAVAGNTNNNNNDNYYFALKTDGSSENDTIIRSYSVIVASGANPRKLELPGEDQLWGVSLHNCAICDGHIYQAGSGGFDDEEPIKTTVLVVGGGDAALDAALLLSRYATKVILVHRRNEFTKVHNRNSLHLIQSSSKIEILTPYTVQEWITQKDDPSQLTGVKLLHKEKEIIELQIDGAFVMIGATPNTDWINTKQTSTGNNNLGLDLDEEGLIKTTIQQKGTGTSAGITSTNIPGLFAAGEVTDNIYKQAITAASAGAQAAIDAERWLREHRPPSQSKSQPKQQQQQQQQQRITTKTNADAEEVAAASVVVDENKKDIKINIKKNDDDDDNCDLTLEDCINRIIHKYPVVVFSKPSCPYCRKALEALSLAGISQNEKSEHNDSVLHVIDLSQHSNTQEIQRTLQTMTGRRTVPNVFVGGTSIGGGDETSKFQRNGQLVPLLEKAGAFMKKNIENDNDNDTASSLMKNKTLPSSDTIIKDGNEKVEEKTNASSIDRKTVDKVAPATNDVGDESCDLAYEECFLEIIDKYSVVMFTLSWCPECKRMLELLNRIGVDTTNNQVHIIDLDDYKPISGAIRQHMKKLTGRRSVPNLFIDSEFIGGFSQTNEMHEQGQLIPKFINAEIITPTLFGLTHIHHSRSEPHRHHKQ